MSAARLKCPPGFGKPAEDGKVISVYHPHGSFETRDVVCSSFQEQKQLSLHMAFKSHPMLLLGYSGYEPSLYRHLEISGPQLWCIRHRRDLEIPAKRRLLCRRNTQVFVGDMLELLRALGVLHEDVNLTSAYLALEGRIPPKVIEVIHCAIGSTLDPRLCSDFLAGVLCGGYEEPEASFRFKKIVGGIENHIRNRALSSDLPLALMAAAQSRNHERLWVSLLAFLLRRGQPVTGKVIERTLKRAEEARKQREAGDDDESAKLISAVSQARTRCYKSFLGRPERADDDARNPMLNQVSWMTLGDMALGGELAEVAAFACLNHGEEERARGFFDSAATYYYLTGLWNAGQLNEWASQNIETIKPYAKDSILRIPMAAGKTA